MTNPSKMLRELRDALQNMLEAYGEETDRTCVVQAREALALTAQAARAISQAAAEPVPQWKVCGRCLGRGRRDVAHGETEPCGNCDGRGAVRTAPDRAPSTQPEHEEIIREGDTLVCTACGTTSRAPSTDSATAPKFDEAEFAAMVKHGTEVWGKEPANIAEILRAGGTDSATVTLTQQQLSDVRARAIAETVEKFADTATERDAARLDWLDEVNRRANERNGTSYGWKFDINHNRAALTDCNFPVMTIREAIDAAIAAMKGEG